MQIVGYPLAFCLTGLLESLSGLLALGYVLDNDDKVLGFARRLPHERDSEVNPGYRAAFLEVALLHRVGFYLSGQKLVNLLEVGVEVVRMGYVLESLLQQLLTTVADYIAEPLVDPQPSSVQRVVGDADGCLLECGPKALFALPELLFGPLALRSLFCLKHRAPYCRNEPLQPLLQYVVRGAAFEGVDRPLFPQSPGDENEWDLGTDLLSNL